MQHATRHYVVDDVATWHLPPASNTVRLISKSADVTTSQFDLSTARARQLLKIKCFDSKRFDIGGGRRIRKADASEKQGR